MSNNLDHLTFFGAKKKTQPLKAKYSKVLPEVNPISLQKGLFIFGGMSIIGMSIGATIGTYVFFGTATLTGLIVVIESNKYLKLAAQKSNQFIDITILVATIVATANLGITITAALTFAGLGYTLIYSPYLRSTTISKE